MESAGNPDKQEENVNEKTDSGQFDNNRFPSKNQTSNYSSANNENSLEQSSSKPISSKNSKNENEIKVIFHAHFPENTAKIGHPVIFGDGKALGSWEHPNITLRQPFPQIPTYWQSNPVNISTSNIIGGHAIQYRYGIHTMEGKIVFEGDPTDNRILDTARNDQFGIWKNNLNNQALCISSEKIKDFAFVNFIFNSINADNLKDKVIQFQQLLADHEDLTIRASNLKFIINRLDDESKAKRLFLCLLLGYHIQRQTLPYELPNEFPSELLLDALEGYKQDTLPQGTRDQMCIAITTLVHHNAFQMQFNWLKVFTIAAKVDPNYTFIDHLRALRYPNDSLLATLVQRAEIIRPYIDGIDFEAYVKLAKWLIQLCHNMEGLSHLWSDVFLHNAEFDRNIFKCFANRVQENISDDDAIALDAHFKGLPQSCRSEVSSVFRDHSLLLLKSPSSKWTDQNIFAIRKLLQDVNLNWNGDDVILALELISKSNDFGLLSIFPELLDGWFRKDFSDTKKRIPNICVNWFTLFLIKLSTNENAFVFLVFQQLDLMHPLLNQRSNIWREFTKIAIKRVKKCSEAQIFAATKFIVHLKRDEFKSLFTELVKKVLSKSVQNINDQLIDKLFVICNCVDKTKPLHVPNLMCEDILCHVMIKLQSNSLASSRSEHHLNTLEDRKFWNVILCATGSVKNLNSNSYVKHIKASINELSELLIERTIDIKSLRQLLKYSDEELFNHFVAAAKKKTSSEVISLEEIAKVRELCDNFQLQSDILFKFYERFCSTAQDVNVYLQQLQSSDKANLRQGLTSDYWLFHEKTINSANHCYKFNQSQTFRNVFEICLQEDAAAKKVEYIAQTLIPTVFKRYNAFCMQFREWEKLKCSDASLFWKNVTNFNVELEFMGGYEALRDNKFVQSLDHISKIPQWIERLERLDKVAYIFNIPREAQDWLSRSIHILKDDSMMLGQINSFFGYLHGNLSGVNNDCWELIREISNADDFMNFLKEIAQHDITNLINVIDDNADEKLVKEEDTASSLIQVKQFLFPLMDKNIMESVADVLEALSIIIKKNSALVEKIILCKNSNMALQNMYNSISTRSKVTKEKIKNAVANGIYTFKRDGKEEKCTVTLVFTSKTEILYNFNEILDLRGRALLIVKTIIDDKDMEIQKDVADDFITQVDTAQEIISVVSALIQTGHFDYRSFEKTLRGTKSMKKFLKFSKDELNKWEDIVNQAQKGCYYLTFFPARHVLTFYDYFISDKQFDNYNEEKCRTLIKSINNNVQLPSRKDYLEILCEIGDGLKRIFRNIPKQTREFIITKQRIMSDIVAKGKLFVAACTDKSRVPNIIMSLYANHGFYPESWQLLICTSTTTLEELSIFIKRSFFASNNGYENNLFCIANLEELEIELQYILVDQIRSLRESYNQYLLALICCKETEMYHYILDQPSLVVHSTNGLDTEEMREIYQELCRNVICVTSDLSGQGKTEWIKEVSSIKKKVPRSFLIRDGMDFGTILRQFKECKLRPEESLHINIVSSDHPEDVNMFLFELLTLDIASSNVVDTDCISTSESPTYIFIEVASTSHQRLLHSLPMASYLLSKHLTWNIENLRISRQINSPIQITCHYLNLYDRNEIDTKEILLRTDDAIKEPLPIERCHNLIEKYFFHENSEDVSSFRFVEIYVNDLAEQLVQLSSSQFFSVENLKLMMEKEANIGSLIVGTLMEVSKDLAIRSIQTKAAQLESLTSENARLGTIAHWDESNKLIGFFNSKIPYLLYRDSSKVHDIVKALFKSVVIEDRTEWELDDYNAIPANAIVTKLEDLARRSTEKLELPEYALSRDNLIKMALILLRAHANIPVIVCGETGCGKTSLIAYLAILSGVQYQALNLHAGINEETIMTFMDDALKIAEKGEIWLLFDEINTCNHMGLFADLISRRIFNGKPIHPNIRLFSACNPYRLRTRAQSVTGLTKHKKYEQQGNLVYQVKPLPDQILDYVWDYGILKSNDECKYIQTLVEKELKDLAHPVFTELLFASQKFIRKVEEPSSVSLRDVKRAITLMKFFYNSLENRPPLKKGHKYPPSGNPTIKTRSYILAISLCYHSRLCDHELRKQYRHEMEQILQNHKVYEGENMFSRITREEQEDYINRMKCPPNTAKNEALLENVLSLIACILTRIPLFLIGASGSSKSLAIQIISSSLRGFNSSDKYFRSLPHVYLIPYQGSSFSTSDGIVKVFEKANRYQETDSKQFPIISVVLLDNVGLAEKSPFNPLKVLHSLLEPNYPEKGPNVSVIGISNWRLDNSKSNRALLVHRPKICLDELVDTTKNLLLVGPSQKLALERLAKAYLEYEGSGQDFPNFHGLRDYYSLIKRLSLTELTPVNIQIALAHNFGGTPNHAKLCNRYFGDVIETFNNEDPWFYEQMPIEQLIDSNLDECDTRHLMVIGKSDSIVDLLSYQLRRKNLDPVVILGSQFPDDQDDYSSNVMNRIMMCVEAGKPLILTNLEMIYGNLYDLWDKNYIVVGSKENVKHYTRVALGAYSNPMFYISPNFKCILVMDEKKLDSADPSLLNRFEKQKMSINDALNDRQKLLTALSDWVRRMTTLISGNSKSPSCNNEFTQKDLFIGFNKDETLQSLIINLTKNNSEAKDDEILKRCKECLIAIASSDGILRSKQSALERVEVDRWKEIYFQQHHDSLYDYFDDLFNHEKALANPKGNLVIVNTFSNINTDVKSCLQESLRCQVDKLSTFKTEAQISHRVKHFWLESTDQMLILQCDVTTDNFGCIKLAKYVIEQFRNEFIAKKDQMDQAAPMKHACIILHIHRELEHTLPSFNFMCGWKQMTIETLSRSDIPLYNLLDGSLPDIINSTYPFEKILKQELMWCLSCMKYPSNDNSANHIKILSEKILEYPSLVKCLKVRAIEWVKEKSTNDWQYKVATNKQNLYPYASFSVALQTYIRTLVRIPIAQILYALERLSATKTFFYIDNRVKLNDDGLLEFWKQIYMDRTIIKIEDLPDPKPNGYVMTGSLYDLKFPFSFYFMNRIDKFKVFYEEELTILQKKNAIENSAYELHLVIEDHLKSFRNNILTSVPQLKDSPLDRVPELYFNDFVTVITARNGENVNASILSLILKLLVGDKVYQPIFLHAYWWKNAKKVLAQLQLAQMAPEIIQNIEDQDNVNGSLERYLVREITRMMLQRICENEDDATKDQLLDRWQHDVNKVLSLSNKIMRSDNLPDLHLLRVVKDLVATNIIPLVSIREIVQLGLNSNNKREVFSEEFVSTILDKLDKLERNEKNSILRRSFIMRCLELIPIDSDVRISLYKKLFSSEPFPSMGAIIEKIFISENNENERIFFTIIANPKEILRHSDRLNVINECFKVLDTNMATLCCDIIEQTFFMNSELDIDSFGVALEVLYGKVAPLQKIAAIALLKEFVRRFWDCFFQKYNKTDLDSAELINQINNKMAASHPLINPLKFYFLRELCQRDFSMNGVRKFCEDQKNVLPWLGTLNWEGIKETRLPFNPYCELPEYHEAERGLTVFYSINNRAPFKKFIQNIKRNDTLTAKLSLMGLLFARLHFLRASGEWQHPETQSADLLTGEIVGMKNLPELFKTITTNIVSNKFPFLQIDNSENRSNDLFLKSVIAHIITYFASVEPDSSQLAMYLHRLQDCHKLFILSCAPDSASVVYNELAGGFVRLACECGVISIITDCGDAINGVVTSICTKCNRKVTGTVIKPSFAQVETIDQPGYIREPVNQNLTHIVRSLPANSYRILHLIVHVLIGASAPQPALDFLQTNDQTVTDAENYCTSHIQNDWEILKNILNCSDETLALTFHSLISLMTEQPLPNQQVTSSDERKDWEMEFHNNYIEPQLRNITETVSNYRTKLQVAEANNNINVIEDEINQNLAMDKQYRIENLPSLWRKIGVNDFISFREYYIHDLEENTNNYPFLSLFIKYFGKLELLKHLLPIVKFVQILNSKLGYHLTRSNAKDMTFRKFLENESDNLENREKFHNAFKDFKLGWDTVIPFVRRYRCIELPNDKPVMKYELPVVFGLIEPKDSGVYLCAILEYLVSIQNNFLREVMTIPPGTCRSLMFLDEPTFDIEQTVVPFSKVESTKTIETNGYYLQSMRIEHVKSENIVNFYLDNEILSYSHRNLAIARGCEIAYDLTKIEAELAKLLVFDKVYIETQPESQLYLETFPYHMELFATCIRILDDIKNLIPQEPIPNEKMDSLGEQFLQLNSDDALEILSSLEILLSFIKRITVGVGESLIKDYVLQWMKLSSLFENKGFSKLLNIDLKLKHLVALYEFIEEQIANVKITNIHERYKAPLSIDMETAILQSVNFKQETAEKELIPAEAFALALKRFMFRFLLLENQKQTESLYIYLQDFSLNFWPSTVSERLIDELFPENLMFANTFAAHEFTMKRIEKTREQANNQQMREQAKNLHIREQANQHTITLLNNQQTRNLSSNQQLRKQTSYQQLRKHASYQQLRKQTSNQQFRKPVSIQEVSEQPSNQDIRAQPSGQEMREQPSNQEMREQQSNQEMREQPSNQEMREQPNNQQTQSAESKGRHLIRILKKTA